MRWVVCTDRVERYSLWEFCVLSLWYSVWLFFWTGNWFPRKGVQAYCKKLYWTYWCVSIEVSPFNFCKYWVIIQTPTSGFSQFKIRSKKLNFWWLATHHGYSKCGVHHEDVEVKRRKSSDASAMNGCRPRVDNVDHSDSSALQSSDASGIRKIIPSEGAVSCTCSFEQSI